PAGVAETLEGGARAHGAPRGASARWRPGRGMTMAVPTITSITPARGPSSGQTLLALAGTGMRLLPPPPPAGPTRGRISSTVEVRIGGVPAGRAAVRIDPATPPSGTIAVCLTPPGTPGTAD